MVRCKRLLLYILLLHYFVVDFRENIPARTLRFFSNFDHLETGHTRFQKFVCFGRLATSDQCCEGSWDAKVSCF